MIQPSAPAPVTYRADTGRQRAFPRFTDAAAYDRGYRNYPLALHAEPGTPEAIGWADHRDDAEGAAAMDDCAAWAVSHPNVIGLHLP